GLRRRDPGAAAAALRSLGDHRAAARVLVGAGRLPEAANEFLRGGHLMGAAVVYERMKDPERAIEAYVAAGELDRAAKVAQESGRWAEELARLLAAGSPELSPGERAEVVRRAGDFYE